MDDKHSKEEDVGANGKAPLKDRPVAHPDKTVTTKKGNLGSRDADKAN